MEKEWQRSPFPTPAASSSTPHEPDSHLLILAVIFAEVGFALHVLWIIAIVNFVAWLVGLAFGRGSSPSARH